MNGLFAGRTVATGAMVLWTMACLMVAGRIPLLGALIMAFAGMPALLIVLAWGGAWFLLYGSITLTLTFFWGGLISSLMLIPMMFVPAMLLAATIRKGFGPMQAIGRAIVLACAFSTALWVISPLLGTFGGDLWSLGDQFRAQGKVLETQIRALNKGKEVDGVKMDLFIGQMKDWIEFIALLTPITFLFVWHLISMGVFYLGAMHFSPSFGYAISALPKFSTWNFNWNIVWAMFGGWFLFYGAGYFEPVGLTWAAKVLGANFLAISKILFFIAGFSLLFHFFDTYGINGPLRVGFSLFAVIFNQLVVWLGIADIWLDFRAPPPKKAKEPENDEDSFF